jgi:hypothetical protein
VITLHAGLAGYQTRGLMQLAAPTGVVSFFENRVLP